MFAYEADQIMNVASEASSVVRVLCCSATHTHFLPKVIKVPAVCILHIKLRDDLSIYSVFVSHWLEFAAQVPLNNDSESIEIRWG